MNNIFDDSNEIYNDVDDLEPIENVTSECYKCDADMCDICKSEQYYYNIEHYTNNY